MGTYISPVRRINTEEVLKASIIRLKQKNYLDLRNNEIVLRGIDPNYRNEAGEKRIALQVVLRNKKTFYEQTYFFDVIDELDVSPRTMVNFYTYIFDGLNLKMGASIKITQAFDANGQLLGNFVHCQASTAIVINANCKMITYVIVASRGEDVRYITAREAYKLGVQIYVYDDADTETTRPIITQEDVDRWNSALAVHVTEDSDLVSDEAHIGDIIFDIDTPEEAAEDKKGEL